MAANNIYIQVDLNAASAQANVNALNNALALTGPTSEKSAKQTTGALATVNVSVSQTTKAFGELGTAIAGLGIERAVASMIQVSSEMGRARQMMEFFTGSAEEAAKILDIVEAIAKQSPFRFKDLEESARTLAGFGYKAKDIPPMLKAITDQAAAMGGSIEEVNSFINIFGRVADKNFVSAMDLLRKFPALGVKVGDALMKALNAKDMQEVMKILKEQAVDSETVMRLMIQTMAQATGGAAAKMNDAQKAFKNLGIEIEKLIEKLMGDKGFGPQLVTLAHQIGMILAPLGEFFQMLGSLPPDVKQLIVDLTALALAFGALATALALLAPLAAPLAGIIESLTGFEVTLAALNPELILAAAGIAGLGYALYELSQNKAAMGTIEKYAGVEPDAIDKWIGGLLGINFPSEKDAEKQITDWFHGVTDTLKKGQDAAQDAVKAAAAAAKNFAAGRKVGKETPTNLEEAQTQVKQWADAAGKTVLQALGSPADAVILKYNDLFAKLGDLIHYKQLEDHADELRAQLSAARELEINAKLLEKKKQDNAEFYKTETEAAKSAYDAQILYIEAQDAQDLRTKVANIDKITALRQESAETVARLEKEHIEDDYNAQVAFLEKYKQLFTDAGLDLTVTEARLRDEANAKEKEIDRKNVDDQQKYRLEGWKKANDAIIEDQKRVYEAFQSMFDEIFDAFTQKTKSIGQALGDVFKKLALGEAKNFFSSQAASFATELAGYGTPEPGIRRGGGILGTLLQRGMPPRPMMAPPEAYVPAKAESGISFGNIVDGGGKGGANREIANAAGVYNVSAIVFSNAVNRFSDATVSHQGSADRMMESSSDISEASDAIQRASTATGVPQSLLRAVARTESGMHPGAVSPKGAQGLFQLMPATQQDFGVTNPFDPYQSAIAGGGYLQQLYTRYGSWPAALAAYNYGPTNYNRAVAAGRSLPAETQAYVQRVMGLLGGGMPQPAAATGGPVYDVGARFSVTGYGAPETAEGGYTPMAGYTPMGGYSPISGADIGSLTAVATPTEIEKAKQASVLAQVLGVVGTDVNKAATGGGGSPQQAGLLNLSKLSTMFGIGQATGGGTTLGSVLSSKGISNLVGLGGMAAIGAGLNKRNAPLTTLGGAMAGFGMTGTSGMALPGGAVLGPLGGVAVGAGAGLYAAGIQRGGFGGMAMDIGGGALAGAALGFTYGGPLGAAIGAGIGAAVGAITGVVRLFVKTEQEKIRAQIKQVYGIDIPNRQILTQIQQIVDQSYGGNVAVGIRSQQVQDLVRLYALSTGQAAMMPRPMYAATIAQSTQGLQLQPVYQGGTQVANPYSGPTTYQYQTAVIQAMGANPNPGSGMGVPGAAGLINTSFQQLSLQTIQGNPASIAMANAAAATAGDSRLTTTAAMQEPLTALS